MIQLNYLEKLLGGVDVEWLPLGELAEVRSGWGFPTAYQGQSVGTYPFYKVSDMNIVGNETEMGLANNYISDSDVNKLKVSPAPAGTIIFPKIGAAVATNKKRLLSTKSAYDNNVMGLIPSDKISSRFLFYWMQTINLSTLANDSGAVPSIRKSEMQALLIPIACPDNPEKSLAIQAEIVRILDAFTAMTAELTAELNMRKKQYNYYRDQLLSFDLSADQVGEGEVEWKTLGDVCEIGDGNHSSKYPRSDEMVEQGVPFIRGTNMVSGTISSLDMKFITPEKHQELKKGHLKAYDVLIANRGEIGKIAQVPKNFSGANLNSQLAWLRAKHVILLPRFLFYVLNTSHVQSTISGEGGALQQLTIKNIKLIRIPVPSIEKQSGIAAILDKFDALTNSITEGLPREIELRRKQYEYYRDLLLSFPASPAGGPKSHSDEAA